MCSGGGSKPSRPGSSCPPGTSVASCATNNDQICPGKDNKELQSALDEQAKMLKAKKAELERWNDADKEKFKKWFGTTDEEARKKIQKRIDDMIALNKETTPANFKKADPPKAGRFAYVYPNDKTHTIYLDDAFCRAADTGKDSRAGTLCHEMSHFKDIGGTKDHIYGAANCQELAKTDSAKALTNADSFEYYLENVE